MENYKLRGSVATLGINGLHRGNVKRQKTKKCDLPPLSMNTYVFTGKKLQKKAIHAQRTIKEAEGLMALELGKRPSQMKNQWFWKLWKRAENR